MFISYFKLTGIFKTPFPNPLIIRYIVQLVVQPPLISGGTFITVLRLLWVMCAACPQLALALHQRSIADTLLCLLTGSTVHHEVIAALYPQAAIESAAVINIVPIIKNFKLE